MALTPEEQEEFDAWDGSLACPQCGSTELATIENIMGTAALTLLTANEMEFDGYTKIDWDTSETVGIACTDCYWEDTESSDIREKLKPSWTFNVEDDDEDD